MNRRTTDQALRTQNREVTLLFADLRGFTELAGSLELEPVSCEVLAHVMDSLTDAVVEHEGTVVDYYGDGLVAMWNAPRDQAEHPELACGAALRMLESLPVVTAEWIGILKKELRLGIGVHTGTVQVGNAGSTRQTKYGPRGTNVNLTSRVEAATKEVRLPFLATQPTVVRLSKRFSAHRVCRGWIPGLPQPVELYAVGSVTGGQHVADAWLAYDKALRQFEHDNFAAAADILATIDPSVAEVPKRFLGERIEREIGRHQRRRSSDKPAARQIGVIVLGAK